jgi:hypothetical protein
MSGTSAVSPNQPNIGTNAPEQLPLPKTTLGFSTITHSVVAIDGTSVDKFQRTYTLPSGKVLDFRTVQRMAWVKGFLKHKLDIVQQDAYDKIRQSTKRRWILNWGRRTGKSFFLLVLALEAAIQNPGHQIKFATANAKAARKIIRPLMRKILADCPKDLQPEFNAQEGEYRFKNGSTITVAGCDDGNADSLRGTESHLNIIDEAGFVSDLDYVLKDILNPMTLTTKGKTLLSSTPPRSLAHPYVRLAQEAERVGSYIKKTLYDNARISNEDRDAFVQEDAELAGISVEDYKSTTTFLREYMAEFVADSDYAVIQHWNQLRPKVVQEVERPAFFDAYEGIDFGYSRDAHGVVFGYWDYRAARFVVEDCLRLVKKTSDVLVAEIRAKELALWGEQAPYLRIADSGGQGQLLIADLVRVHGLSCVGTAKDNKEAAINAVQVLLNSGKMVIHPRCTDLIQQLNTTIWNEQRTSFERNQLGHGDLLDALVYLVRNINRTKNPYPDDEPLSWTTHAHPYRRKRSNDDGDAVILELVGMRTGTDE